MRLTHADFMTLLQPFRELLLQWYHYLLNRYLFIFDNLGFYFERVMHVFNCVSKAYKKKKKKSSCDCLPTLFFTPQRRVLQGVARGSYATEIYRRVEGILIVGPSCIVSNWNIYEPINHFCCCSPPDVMDTAPIGRRTPGLLRYAGMLHRGSSDFFELLVEGGRPNDSRQQQIQDGVVARQTRL